MKVELALQQAARALRRRGALEGAARGAAGAAPLGLLLALASVVAPEAKPAERFAPGIPFALLCAAPGLFGALLGCLFSACRRIPPRVAAAVLEHRAGRGAVLSTLLELEASGHPWLPAVREEAEAAVAELEPTELFPRGVPRGVRAAAIGWGLVALALALPPLPVAAPAPAQALGGRPSVDPSLLRGLRRLSSRLERAADRHGTVALAEAGDALEALGNDLAERRLSRLDALSRLGGVVEHLREEERRARARAAFRDGLARSPALAEALGSGAEVASPEDLARVLRALQDDLADEPELARAVAGAAEAFEAGGPERRAAALEVLRRRAADLPPQAWDEFAVRESRHAQGRLEALRAALGRVGAEGEGTRVVHRKDAEGAASLEEASAGPSGADPRGSGADGRGADAENPNGPPPVLANARGAADARPAEGGAANARGAEAEGAEDGAQANARGAEALAEEGAAEAGEASAESSSGGSEELPRGDGPLLPSPSPALLRLAKEFVESVDPETLAELAKTLRSDEPGEEGGLPPSAGLPPGAEELLAEVDPERLRALGDALAEAFPEDRGPSLDPAQRDVLSERLARLDPEVLKRLERAFAPREEAAPRGGGAAEAPRASPGAADGKAPGLGDAPRGGLGARPGDAARSDPRAGRAQGPRAGSAPGPTRGLGVAGGARPGPGSSEQGDARAPTVSRRDALAEAAASAAGDDGSRTRARRIASEERAATSPRAGPRAPTAGGRSGARSAGGDSARGGEAEAADARGASGTPARSRGAAPPPPVDAPPRDRGEAREVVLRGAAGPEVGEAEPLRAVRARREHRRIPPGVVEEELRALRGQRVPATYERVVREYFRRMRDP
ncbi:MAG: hypothetical protein D6731_14610 [Planctomycetota bacterium]|nr:MAG: hypothetical protein D6731_14610 [Planctomycetota bacterium]